MCSPPPSVEMAMICMSSLSLCHELHIPLELFGGQAFYKWTSWYVWVNLQMAMRADKAGLIVESSYQVMHVLMASYQVKPRIICTLTCEWKLVTQMMKWALSNVHQRCIRPAVDIHSHAEVTSLWVVAMHRESIAAANALDYYLKMICEISYLQTR